MTNAIEKPKIRSDLRLWLGKIFYTLKRYGFWLFGGLRFARRTAQALPYAQFQHQTPLLRKLKDADMILQHNKVTNLKIAAQKVDGITLGPGEVFSYWKTIGRPSRVKGYLEGMVLKNGGIHAGIGGGLCQLSNLIFWMTAHTPLTVIERHRHGYDVFPDSERSQPFGSGATCFYNYGDLMIRNDTEQSFRLTVGLTPTHLTGSWTADRPPSCSYRVYEREHFMRAESFGGYSRHNLLYRKSFSLEGEEIADEYLIENHALMMYSPFLEAGQTNKARHKKTGHLGEKPQGGPPFSLTASGGSTQSGYSCLKR
ncbi:MAG: VanW family protein [Christensenellaceae bacterium]|jgi:vancomycin resistance protein VanW|nr:VanW family protein [Christensenellaceae bacterium]